MFIAMANALRKFVKKWVLIISIIPISFASSFLSMYEIPTVGASGMVYAMIGIFISISVLADNIIVNKKIYMLLICSIGLSLLISYLKGNSNFWLHIFCLLFGIAAGIMIEIIKEIQHSQ
jgi:membrane associated rhomboid family serine protease